MITYRRGESRIYVPMRMILGNLTNSEKKNLSRFWSAEKQRGGNIIFESDR